MGRQLGFHVLLRFCCYACGLEYLGVQDGLRRRNDSRCRRKTEPNPFKQQAIESGKPSRLLEVLLNLGRHVTAEVLRTLMSSLPGRDSLCQRTQGSLPNLYHGLLPVCFRGHHHHPCGWCVPCAHEFQGLDDFCTSLDNFLLHRR